ncbi:hypothetical protein L6R52_44475, partial [Myxococcota bacterium]|nr:hypothetical protein [Myxococcota bacterium]
SSDPDGDVLTHAWRLEASPEGSLAAVDDASKKLASITPDRAGVYVVSLTVRDGRLTSRDLVTLTAIDVATSTATLGATLAWTTCNADLDALGDAPCAAGDHIVADAALTDPAAEDAAEHGIEWTFLKVPAGVTPALLAASTSTAARLSFTPPRPGEYWLAARATGPRARAVPALASVAVFADGPPARERPRAELHAKSEARVLDRVFLDGRASTSAAGVVRRWSLAFDPSSGADDLADLATGCPTDTCRILFPTSRGLYVVALAIEQHGAPGATALTALEVK